MKCPQCGGPTERAERRKRPRTYCSPSCYHASRRIESVGTRNPKWRGGRYTSGEGRAFVRDIEKRSYLLEHRIIAERALGKPLPPWSVVHHVNENPRDNRPENLVLCQDGKYHTLLHMRTRIVRAGGLPRLHKMCCRCRRLVDRSNFHRRASALDGLQISCKPCSAEASRKRNAAA